MALKGIVIDPGHQSKKRSEINRVILNQHINII